MLTVQRMLLSDILRLCVLVGRERTSNSLLPLVITVLNHRGDWQVCLNPEPETLNPKPETTRLDSAEPLRRLAGARSLFREARSRRELSSADVC